MNFSAITSAFLSKSKDASLSMCIIFVTVVFCRDASTYSFYLDLIIGLSLSYRLMADGFHSSFWKWIKEWEGVFGNSFKSAERFSVLADCSVNWNTYRFIAFSLWLIMKLKVLFII